jgi:integrase
MDRSQLDSLARRYLSTRFDHTEEWLAETSDEVARDVIGDELAERGDAVTAALAYGDYSSALDRARDLLPDADELTRAKLARRLLEAELEAIKAECRALSGEPLVFPSLASVASAAANDDPKETPRLSEVLAALVEERSSQGKWTAKTKLERETAGGVIVELLGDPRVGDVTKDDMRAFGLNIARIPTHVHKRFPRKTVAEVLATIGDDPKVERLSPVSVNLYLQLTRSLFAWAVENDKIKTSPAVVLHDHDEGDKQKKRAAFTEADIRQFLEYIGDAGGEPWLWWIPRILALSGMRLGEVAQLRAQDVREERGVLVFDVNEDVEGKNVKTAVSWRLVPVHPRLVALGLHDFIAAQPDGFLWPEKLRLTADPRKGNVDRLSRLLNDRIRRAGINDRRKVVHSFRHTFRDRLSDAEVPTHVIKAIIGHTDTDITTGIYGSRPSPAKMLAAVEKVTLPV